MNSVDSLDKKDMIFKYGKYILLILLIIIVVVLLFFRGNKTGYDSIENQMINAAKKYVQDNNITIVNNSSKFIEMPNLGEIDGTGLCKKASGVIVTNKNGTVTYEPYLKCDDYVSNTKKQNNKYITLVGDQVVLLNKGEVYVEQYYTLSAEANVIISGTVGKEVGVYTIYYYVYVENELKEIAYRTVIVVENNKNKNITDLTDKVNPVLTLKGQKEVVIGIGEHYEEEGYTAYDYEDGTLNRRVTYNPNPETIDTSVTKEYTIVYSVTNSKGNQAQATRKITVVRRKGNIKVNLTQNTKDIAKSVTIYATISGEGYERMIAPLSTRSTNFMYEATKNGPYTFVIKDVYGNLIKKTIEIDNIDDIPPSGNCTATVIGSNTSVEVKASDNMGIAGYSYILDEGEATKFTTSSSYKATKSASKVSVKVKDVADNIAVLKCAVTVKKTTVVSGRKSGDSKVIDTSEYNLVVTKNDTIAFAKLVDSLNVAQNNPPGYPDYCLSFAYYHAYSLYNGDNLSSMSAEKASKYTYATMFQRFVNDNKQIVLSKIYELINGGKPVVLHVNGNKAGTSRHYVTVVGYKKSVTSAATISEQDLLIIDSYDGVLERMDRDTSRFMISGYDTGRTGKNGYGYQIYMIK